MERETVVLEGIEAFNRRDVEALLATMSADIEIVPFDAKLFGTSYHGEAGIRRWVAEMETEWSELRVQVDETRAIGEDVVVIGRMVGRTKDTEVDVDLPAAFLSTIHDGRLIRMESYSDAREALAAAGLHTNGNGSTG